MYMYVYTHSLQGIDKCLSEQIQYLTQVSTMQPHEGSVYGAEKVGGKCRTYSD